MQPFLWIHRSKETQITDAVASSFTGFVEAILYLERDPFTRSPFAYLCVVIQTWQPLWKWQLA